MRKAAHYIYNGVPCKLHYIEVDQSGSLKGIFPLASEIAGTEFYDGVIFALAKDAITLSTAQMLGQFKDIEKENPQLLLWDILKLSGLVREVLPGEQVVLFRLAGVNLPAAKLGASDSSRNCYIERL